MVSPGAGAARGRRLEGAAAFVVLLAVAYVTFGRAFDLRPLGSDNLYVLSWANRAPASSLARVDPVIYPEWRPLAYLTVWLQYRWSGIDGVVAYQVVNLLIWTLCGWLVYRIVVHLAGSPVAGLAAALLVLTDVRAITAQTLIVERQMTMAAGFGLGAMWMLARSRDRRLSTVEWSGLFLLCLAAALSKEYGLAFAGAIVVYGAFERRADLMLPAGAAAVVYAGLRLGFAGGANAAYCEYMGYFSVVRKVCYDGFDATGLTQMAYNVSATGIGTVLPGLFSADGKIGLAPFRLVASAGWLAVAVLGWRKGPRLSRLTGLVMLVNTALSFMLYQGRNQIAAVCVLGIVIGVGLTCAERLLQARPAGGLLRAGAATAVVVLLWAQIAGTRVEVDEQVADLLSQDPCSEIMHTDQHDPALIRQIKAKYGMTNPDCVPGR